VSSIKPDDSRSQIDGSEEVTRGFVVASRDGAIGFELRIEVFDEMAFFVQLLVIGPGVDTSAFRRDDGVFAGVLEGSKNAFVSVISFVGNNRIGLDALKKSIGAIKIVSLSRCQE
jgi:hypothetical protein